MKILTNYDWYLRFERYCNKYNNYEMQSALQKRYIILLASLGTNIQQKCTDSYIKELSYDIQKKYEKSVQR